MKRLIQSVLLTCVGAALSGAQGQYGRGAGTAAASSVDVTRVQTITGTVSAVAIGYGMQYPSITIGKVQIKVAPVWYLLDKNFEIKTGASLSVQAAPSISKSDSYAYAIEITNTALNRRIVLRDALGRPLWTSSQSATGGSAEGSCPLGSATAVSGTVERVNIGIGIQLPTLTLRTTDGTPYTVKLGPEWILLESDLELKPGEVVTVKYASCASCNDLIALTITNAAGKTVVLRDENGRPGWH
jgi:hypothetical protein